MSASPPRLVLAALLALAPLAAARAGDPRLPILVDEPEAAAKVEAFARARASDPAARAALEAARDLPARDRIDAALRALVPEYGAAAARHDLVGDEPEPWLPLAQSEDRFVRAHATYFLGRALLARDDLEGAAAALEEVRGPLREGTPYTDEATLYLAYVYARLPELRGDAGGTERTRARRLLETLVPGEGARYRPPERVVEGAVWLLRELRGEGLGPLLELAKRMETIERLLRRSTTGRDTQQRQEEVVAAIDRLIELMKPKDQSQSGGGGGQGQQGGSQQQQQGQRGQSAGDNPTGAQRSELPPAGEGTEELAGTPQQADLEAWGEMAPREREQAIQFLRQRFPAKYRELIERYYRALAEQDR